MRRHWFRSLTVLAAVALLLAGLLALLQTPFGKSVLASALSRALSGSGNMEVRIGTISGWIPAKVRVDRLEVGDAQGVWLSVHDLHGRWIMRELLKGRIHLREIGAGEVELVRLPDTGTSASSQPRGEGRFGHMEIQLDGLMVDRLKLGRHVAGMPLEYTVQSGGIALGAGRLSGGVAIGGDAVGRVDFEASLANPAGNQLTLRAELGQMNKPTFGLDRLSGGGEATIDAKGIDARVEADLEKSGQRGHVSTRFHYASGQLRLRQVQFSSQGCSAEGGADLGFSKGLIDVGFDASLVDAANHDYAVSGNASVATSNGTWSVNVESLEVQVWNVASLSVAGRFGPTQVNLAGVLDEFDVGTVPLAGMSNFTGRASGRFSITGSMESPQMSAGLDVSRFATTAKALDELAMLDFRIAAGVSNDSVFASTTLTNFNGGYLVAEFAMPCAFSIAPFRFASHPEKVRGSLDAILDLDIFNGLAVLDNQHVDGILTAELSLEGRVPAGFVELENGVYEHYEWGLLFRGFAARLEAVSDGFAIKKAIASDGYSGRLGLSGGLHGGNLDVALDLSKAKVVRRSDIEAMISGRLKMTGRIGRPSITGRLEVDRADLLPDNMVSAKPLLLTDFDADAPKEDESAEVKARKAFPVGLDVRVDMPDQLYVNASLIDSVWGGWLQVKDSPAGWSVKGTVSPRRGYVEFVGKKFRLVEGEIELDGAVPPMPVLNNLTAEYSRSDITARLILNGNIGNPQCRLVSIPALPEDEILAHVLFNRDTSAISPYQAIQIAAAAQQLSRGLSGPGFMYQFRKAVGIDTLEWREPATGNGDSSVVAGKYITPGLYVEISSTFGTEAQTDMTAEYEINRHFSVETSAGPTMRPGIGLNWKNDY